MTSTKQRNKISKFLSFVLRHKPDEIGLVLDDQGWTDIDELIKKANASEQVTQIDRSLLLEVVDTNEKQRFIISEDDLRIRANQGHSVQIDLQLTPQVPPEVLYHGTATRFLDSILKEGLTPQQRQHVHLSSDIDTATQVGQRYGKPVILKINTLLMHQQGITFYQADNGVWLTHSVPIKYIEDPTSPPTL
jgi:putative RNA 2'-phosphotransferase